MSERGWKQLVDGWPWFRGDHTFPVRGGCEFTHPIWVLRKPFGTWDPLPLDEDDPYGWPVTEYDEDISVQQGLDAVARWVLPKLIAFANGEQADELAAYEPKTNPYWPNERGGPPDHERFVLILPLALSQASDDKGRVIWTVYGGSEQGPAKPVWQSFYTAPGVEKSEAEGVAIIRRIIQGICDVPVPMDLDEAGFRILPQGVAGLLVPRGEPIPSWANQYLLSDSDSLRGVRYLLTFRPYRFLPPAVKRAYRAGKLHLLPYPGSLIFWGVSQYASLRRRLPFAMQVPLLQMLERHTGITGMRVPQSGWFVEPFEDGRVAPHGRHGPMREKIRRTNKLQCIERDEDNLEIAPEHWFVDALFSTTPKDIGLYEKPIARNAQIWDHNFRLLLDGPKATPEQLRRVGEKIEAGGEYGYRTITPAMRVGRYEVYWHRPLIAYRTPRGYAVAVDDGPAGYLTAYESAKPDLAKPVELWPRLLKRPLHTKNIDLFGYRTESRQETLLNVRKLVETWQELWDGEPLPRSLARQLLTTDLRNTLDAWLKKLPSLARDRVQGRAYAAELRKLIEPDEVEPPEALTYHRTANRDFEVAYWNAIVDLSDGAFPNTNNADCILDAETEPYLKHPRRDLDLLGDELLVRQSKYVAEAGMNGRVLMGELPYKWDTDFAYPWMKGWLGNQDGTLYERNLLVVIPGRDRSRAVVLADHYDKAYMADYYDPALGGWGARVAAPGADDNCSATAALLLSAPALLELSRQGKLDCDIWLLHLTGEEYPAAGLGAAEFCREVVEGSLRLRDGTGKWHDLSKTRVRGLYVMDMIAHNVKPSRYIFQIAPGSGREAMWLAYQANLAAERWNASVDGWNKMRKGASRYKRRKTGCAVPDVSPFPRMYGEVRTEYEPRSTLFNTDGQVFSDCGVPVVLFMEDYDICRQGYHDTHDTMANIDLDYGAAFAAICIESVARAATVRPPWE